MRIPLEFRYSQVRFISFVFLGFFVATICAVGRSAEENSGKSGTHLLDSTHIIQIKIDIDPADVALLNGLSRSRLNPGPYVRPTAQATVSEGNRVYTNVAIHLKGTSSFRP